MALRLATAADPGSRADGTRDQPPEEAARQPATGGREAQQPPALDVRLHEPIPQVVIVRVAGTVDEDAAALLARRVGQQLGRAAHVVLDLGEAQDMGTAGVGVLLDLLREARRLGATLHIAGADDNAVRRPLQQAEPDQLLVLAPCADAVIALLAHHPGAVDTGSRPIR